MRRRQGFTLLEVTLVMVVILLMVSIARPSLYTMYADTKLQAGADHLRGRFAQARTRAIEEGRPYRFGVKPDTGDYRLAPDSPEYWGEGTADEQGETEDSAPPLVLEDTLPSAILFQFGDGPPLAESGGWTHLVTFNPDGSCSDDCTIRLDLEDCRPIEMSIRAMTGAVSARSLKPESSR